MELLNLLILGIGMYVLVKCIGKSSSNGGGKTSESGSPAVTTIQHYEEPSNAQIDVSYHKNDYTNRGPPISPIEPGLYGTTRATYRTPTNNLQVDDNRGDLGFI